MATPTLDEFRGLFLRAVDDSIAVAQADVTEPLPRSVRLELGAFERGHRESTLDEVLALLYRDGTFPTIVNVVVRGIVGDDTLISVWPSGDGYVSDLALTWNDPPGMGPFKGLGLALPSPIGHRPRPLSRRDLEEAAPAWAKAER
jgi:hypothetical protein